MPFEKYAAVDFAKVKPALMKMQEITAAAMLEHFKLYNGYVTKYNEVMAETEALGTNEVGAGHATYSRIRSLKTALAFAIGGIVHHETYFYNLGGIGGVPEGKLLRQIEKDFGSYGRFEAEFRGTALAGRGWAFLCWHRLLKRLVIGIGDDQSTYPFWNAELLLACDMYEHAYYLDFKSGRATYTDAFFKNIDWKDVSARLENAIK